MTVPASETIRLLVQGQDPVGATRASPQPQHNRRRESSGYSKMVKALAGAGSMFKCPFSCTSKNDFTFAA